MLIKADLAPWSGVRFYSVKVSPAFSKAAEFETESQGLQIPSRPGTASFIFWMTASLSARVAPLPER